MDRYSCLSNTEEIVEFLNIFLQEGRKTKPVENEQPPVDDNDPRKKWENTVSKIDYIYAQKFNPIFPSENIFNYFAEKYKYELFTEKEINDIIDIEVAHMTQYVCDYLSMSPKAHIYINNENFEYENLEVKEDKKTQVIKANETECITFPYLLPSHSKLLYNINNNFYCPDKFKTLVRYFLTDNLKFLYGLCDKSHLLLNKKIVSKKINNDYLLPEKKSDDNSFPFSPAEFYLFEKLTNTNTMAVLSTYTPSILNQKEFELVMNDTNTPLVTLYKKLLKIIESSYLVFSKPLILEKVLSYNISSLKMNTIYGNKDLDELMKKAEQESKFVTKTGETSSGRKIIFECLENIELDEISDEPIKYDPNNPFVKSILFNFENKKEYKLQFMCVVLSSIFTYVETKAEERFLNIIKTYLTNHTHEQSFYLDKLIFKIKESSDDIIKNAYNKDKDSNYSFSRLIINNSTYKSYKTHFLLDKYQKTVDEYIQHYFYCPNKNIFDSKSLLKSKAPAHEEKPNKKPHTNKKDSNEVGKTEDWPIVLTMVELDTKELEKTRRFYRENNKK